MEYLQCYTTSIPFSKINGSKPRSVWFSNCLNWARINVLRAVRSLSKNPFILRFVCQAYIQIQNSCKTAEKEKKRDEGKVTVLSCKNGEICKFETIIIIISYRFSSQKDLILLKTMRIQCFVRGDCSFKNDQSLDWTLF